MVPDILRLLTMPRLQEHEWACAECGQAYDTTALEAWMVQIVQQRAQAYQLQDLRCRRCRQVCILSRQHASVIRLHPA